MLPTHTHWVRECQSRDSTESKVQNTKNNVEQSTEHKEHDTKHREHARSHRLECQSRDSIESEARPFGRPPHVGCWSVRGRRDRWYTQRGGNSLFAPRDGRCSDHSGNDYVIAMMSSTLQLSFRCSQLKQCSNKIWQFAFLVLNFSGPHFSAPYRGQGGVGLRWHETPEWCAGIKGGGTWI